MSSHPATPESLIHALAHSTGAHMPTMHAAFRYARSVNPEMYDAKLAFWTRAIHVVCVQNGLGLASRYTLDARTLPAALATDGVPPMGLPTVLREMKRKRVIQGVDEFMSGNGTSGKAGSGLWGAVAWGLSALGVWGGSSSSSTQPPEADGISTGVFVLGERVQADVAALAAVAKSLTSLTDSIMTVDEMLERSLLDATSLSKTDVDLLVHAARTAGVLAFDSKTRLVKLVGWRKAVDAEGNSAEMTPLDQRLYTIKHTAAMVAQQVDEIEGRIDGLLEQARSHLRASKKALATRCLAQKKSLTAVLAKRTATLDTLSHMLTQIDSADSDAAVMTAYQAGSSALKDLLADPRLKMDNVDATMDNVADVLADHREVEDAISLHTTVINNDTMDAVGMDADELERELEMLVAEELLDKQAPKVPTVIVSQGAAVSDVQTSPLPQERPAAVKLHARTVSDRKNEGDDVNGEAEQDEDDTFMHDAHPPAKKKAKVSRQELLLAE